jgi:SnoaL-like domain
MKPDGDKAVVRKFLLEGLGGLNPDIVDEVFAPDHALSSPEFGTQVITGTRIIKSAIQEFLRDVGRIECTIQRQIEEGEWVATSYTLTEEYDVHLGILFSRVVAGKITESHVVARSISQAEALVRARKAFN